jgi:hypothetical protein
MAQLKKSETAMGPSELPRTGQTTRSSPRASRREVLIVACVLVALGALFYGSHVLHGGFSIDDWPHAAEVAYTPHPIANEWAGTASRPVLAIYMPFIYTIFGPNPWIHHLWSLFLAVCMSTALYAILRRFSIPRYDAVVISVLVLLFPWSDATRFWATASHINLAIIFGLAGILLALRGLDCRPLGNTASHLYHLGAIALYALSVLTYEITAIALLLVGSLYFVRASARSSLFRWSADIMIIVACLAWNVANSTRSRLPFSSALDHAGEISDGALSLIARSSMPFGLSRTVPLVVLLAIAIGSVAAWRLLPAKHVIARDILKRWLIMAGIGLVIAVAGWVLIIPANPYYNPNGLGVGDRINAVATIGIVIMIYAAAVLLATLIILVAKSVRFVPADQRTVGALSLIVAMAVAVGYANKIQDDQRTWNHAASDSTHVLEIVKYDVPSPGSGSTIYTFDYPGSEQWGIPIFTFSWDLDYAVKLLFDDPSISAYPIVAGINEMTCGRKAMGPSGGEWSINVQGSPYGSGVFVNATTGDAQRIFSPPECRAALRRFPPGPEVRVPSSL